MTEQQLEDLLDRLERERLDADRAYNAALTTLDRAIQIGSSLPPAPRPFDPSRLPDLNQHWNLLPAGPPPIDRSLKGRLRGFVWRLIGPALETQQQFNAALVDHVNRNAAAVQEWPRTLAGLLQAVRHEFDALVRFESLLIQYLQTITAYVDSKDRSLGGSELQQRLALAEQRLLALKRVVETKTTTDGSSPTPVSTQPGLFAAPVDSATYVEFEERFRGPQGNIRDRVQEYVPILATASEVVDIGCGRGELLAVLKQAGVRARGADVNHQMVELCRSRGLDVEEADALTYLERQPDGQIGGLVAIQVVEHFEPAYLIRFLETAHHKMQSGAPIVLETINPACWMAFFETYIRDLTHQRPLHPDTLRYLVEASGFSHVDVQFRRPVGEVDRLDSVSRDTSSSGELARIIEVVNDHAQKLNARLFSSMDYVVIGRR